MLEKDGSEVRDVSIRFGCFRSHINQASAVKNTQKATKQKNTHIYTHTFVQARSE